MISTTAAHIPELTTKLAATSSATAELQATADRHITKALGRLRNHVFKEGKGLNVLTSVSVLRRLLLTPRMGASCSTSRPVSASPRSATVTLT